MQTLREDITTGIRSGLFSSRLEDYSLRWRDNLSDYALATAVDTLLSIGHANELFKILFDPEFRQLRKRRAGINALNRDIRKGMDFFSSEVDLLRYTKLAFLEQATTTRNAKERRIHQGNCKAFADFFQLDVPMQFRANIGVHKIIQAIFPCEIEIDDTSKGYGPSVRVELINYELGSWQCRCGIINGQTFRYDYSCRCGALRSNGLLDSMNALTCEICDQRLRYTMCASCDTRVRLDLMWRLDDGNIHPGALRIPLTLHLSLNVPSRAPVPLQVILMEFPVPLGITELNNCIGFELPDVVWLDGMDDFTGTPVSPLLSLGGAHGFDRRTMSEILEFALSETLKKNNIHAHLTPCIKEGASADLDLRPILTDTYIKSLGEYLIRGNAEGEFVRLADSSRECIIASSSKLSRKMAYVSEHLTSSDGFSVPLLSTYGVVLRDNYSLKPDILTANPWGNNDVNSLDDDGIVRPGALIKRGDLLVGIESPMDPKDLRLLPPGERLLLAIFGDPDDAKRDTSLVYAGQFTGRVLSVDIVLSRRLKQSSLNQVAGKFVRYDQMGLLRYGEWARISVTVLNEHRLALGDKLYRQDGGDAVVCKVLRGRDLRRMFGDSMVPDIVIAQDHPWASRTGQIERMRMVRLNMRSDRAIANEIFSRGEGRYQLITGQPIMDELNSYSTKMEAKDFDWLLGCGCQWIALELYAARCDAGVLRGHFYESLFFGKRDLQSVIAKIPTGCGSLESFPLGTVSSLAFYLKGCGVAVKVSRKDGLTLSFNLMSPDDVVADSGGEVRNPNTLNGLTLKPEIGGLFCERIFGPTRDWECACGKYESIKHKGVVCDRCGVEVTLCRVRRERMGHIKLAVPVSHIWFHKCMPSHIGLMLDMSTRQLERVIYYEDYVVTEPGNTGLERGQPLTEDEFNVAEDTYGYGSFKAGIGAEAIMELLNLVDLAELQINLEQELSNPRSKVNKKKLSKRLKIVQAFAQSKSRPEWMIQTVLPVIPPDLRPLLKLKSGNFATSDLNDLYRLVIIRNNRLKNLLHLKTPEVIIRNEKRMLQEAVDALFDNGRHGRAATDVKDRQLVSLGDYLRNNAKRQPTLLDGLLTRPVDFCARTNLIPEATEGVDFALLPERLAWDLFKPLIIAQLRTAHTFRSAMKLIASRSEDAYTALRIVCDRMTIIAAFESGPWRLIAFRIRLSSAPALGVHPDVLDSVGWMNMGKPVRIYAIHSKEAEEEALARLLPSKLCVKLSFPGAQRMAAKKSNSPFCIPPKDLPSVIAGMAVTQHPFLCDSYDHLVLCCPVNGACMGGSGYHETEDLPRTAE